MNWPLISLNQICDTQYGYTASADDFEVGPKYLRITDIASGPIDWESVPYCKISESDYPKYKLNTGDIVIARTGNTTGYAKLIRSNNDAVFASYLVRIKIKSDLADSGYIGRLIESDIYKNFVRSIKGGAAQGNANATTLTLFKFCLPPIEVQRIIASILSAYDDLIDTNRRRIQLLEESARLLFREWFVYFRFPEHEKVKIVDGVPEGWERVPFPELIDFKEGPGLRNYQFKEEGIPFLNIRTFGDDEIDLSKVGYLDENEVCSRYKHFLLKEDDHVISSSGTLGRLVTVRASHLPLMLNTSLIRMRPKKPMRKWMLKTYLLYGGFIEKTSSLAIGAAQLNFGPAHLNKMTVLFPKNGEAVNEFEKLISEIYLAKKNLLDQNQKLAQARDLLLPRLMNGTIEVSESNIEISKEAET